MVARTKTIGVIRMNNKKNYLDEKNDLNGPDRDKRNYPKRPQHVPITDKQSPDTRK